MPEPPAPPPQNPRMARILKLRRDDPELAVKIENRACPTCGMPPQVLCRAKDGSVAWYHVARTGI